MIARAIAAPYFYTFYFLINILFCRAGAGMNFINHIFFLNHDSPFFFFSDFFQILIGIEGDRMIDDFQNFRSDSVSPTP